MNLSLCRHCERVLELRRLREKLGAEAFDQHAAFLKKNAGCDDRHDDTLKLMKMRAGEIA